VLHFRPSHWTRSSQRLEVTSGELLPDQAAPLLKSRRELSRAEALKLWEEKRQDGSQVCSPQWGLVLPPSHKPVQEHQHRADSPAKVLGEG
jgi:hypothetical protein